MNRQRLFKELNSLCSTLDFKYNINCGGCCYIAACIAENLERYHIPFEIIHYDLCGCHYAIKVSDRYINRSDYRKKEMVGCWIKSSKELYEIYYTNSWNEIYNVRHNSIVKRKINSIFKKCENSRT